MLGPSGLSKRTDRIGGVKRSLSPPSELFNLLSGDKPAGRNITFALIHMTIGTKCVYPLTCLFSMEGVKVYLNCPPGQ